MDAQDIRTLKIFEEIESDQAPSQRELAQKLNVSLGLVNSFVKRLAHMGYFKVTTIPKNRVRYILTPKGVAEKARLTYEYIQFSYKFYKDARQKLQQLFVELENCGVEKVMFFGVSDFAEIAYISLKETDIIFGGIYDDQKNGEMFLNYKIESPDNLLLGISDRILVTAVETGPCVEQSLKAAGARKSSIIYM